MEKANVAALRRAIAIFGSQDALAARMREYFRLRGADTTITQQAISYWLSSGALIDAQWWPAIEFATDGRVTRSDLRPDVFPPAHADPISLVDQESGQSAQA